MGTELDRGDWRLLTELNFGKLFPKQVPTNRLVKLEQQGLVERNRYGSAVITMRGQLALHRRRYQDLPKQRYVIFGNKPRKSFWSKLRRQ